MKIYNLIIGCAMLAALSSCNNWLDLTPADMVEEDELFRDGQGYRNALNGVYKQMATTGMYGCEMSWGLVDVMGQMYTSSRFSSAAAYGAVGKGYNYTNSTAADMIQALWSKTYNSIANCNNLLGRIENEPASKFPGDKLEQDMIQGEALALRAILHFDMLRLFAPAPVKLEANREDASKPYIPYFEAYPSRYEPHLAVNEVLSRIQRDLLKAKDLVALFDTLEQHKVWMKTECRFEAMGGSADGRVPEDIFYTYRGYRMNYYAICAMLARVYNYAGMHREAYDLTQEVIVGRYEGDFFAFTPGDQIAEGNRKMYNDLIFSLSNTKMYDIYESVNEFRLTQPLYLYNSTTLFDDPGDYRKKLTGGTDRSMYPIKYERDNSGKYEKYARDMIPMIRLAEMYYIQAEYYAAQSDWVMVIDRLDKVKMGRNCTGGKLQIANRDAFEKQLIKEANREFMCEGQLFFYYKKLGKYPSSAMKKDEQFYFPLPDNEMIN